MKQLRVFIILTCLSLMLLMVPGLGSGAGNSPFTQLQDALNQVASRVAALQDSSVVDGLHSWSSQIPGKERFVVLADFNDEAVLDRETGLVWQKSAVGIPLTWQVGRQVCLAAPIGGRMGWRLPSIEELASLVDPARSSPALPNGNPFQPDFLSDIYWSVTTLGRDRVWVVDFDDGTVGSVPTDPLDNRHIFWCVRAHGPLTEY